LFPSLIKLLIINYSFPPNSGIGGRRWSKFTNEFDKLNVQYEVIASKDEIDCIGDLNKTLHLIPSGYPRLISKGPRSVAQKILYRIYLIYLKLRLRGNYYDRSVFWYKSLIPLLRIKLSEGFTHLIASGGPFAYLSDVAELKDQFPDVKFIVDFRDPWVNNQTSFGYSELPKKRIQFESKAEKKVIEKFDAAVSVAKPMTDYFISRYIFATRGKFYTIPNGYDLDDKLTFSKKIFSNDRVNIVFTGSLYDKLLPKVNLLIEVLKNEIDLDVQFHFLGEMNQSLSAVLSTSENVKIYGNLSKREALHALYSCDIALLMLTDDLTYSFSTKFCEYIMYEKPIWIISNAGSTPDFVRENGIGFHSLPTPDSIKQGLENIRTSLDTISYEGFDDSLFNLESISKQYLERLVHLVKHDNSLK